MFARFTLIVLILTGMLIGHTCFAASIDDTKKQKDKALTELKQTIKQNKNSLKKLQESRQELTAKLKQDDLAISHIIQQLTVTKTQLNETQQQLKNLEKQQRELTLEKQQQERLLAKQLRAAYSTGHHDYLKLILNQQDSKNVQRTISYYQYLNNARIKEIEQFKRTITELLEITELRQEKAQQLTVLKQQQTTQKKSLEQNKSARQKTVNQLNHQITNNQQRLADLESQEANLVTELKALERLAKKSLRLAGLNQLKNKLSWPVKGKRLHNFGTRKLGNLRWKGILFSAPVGRSVNNIANGKVLFADWLKGYGLVIVVDHGQGYMSLYGHNQTLLKQVGDNVEPGETHCLSRTKWWSKPIRAIF